MPLEMGQTDPILHNSLFYDDKLLLRIRVERLKGAKTYSQKPKSRCHHLMQAPMVEARDDATGEYATWAAFHYVETRLDEQTLYAGWSRHSLALIDGRLKIKLKRVDLVNCDSAFGNIQLFM
ncbi:MAG: phenylpropionate dioxygenase, partial [Alphaproteobacteria bacterium]|nr:phenylpropionate dioxygenase [Alphaproteobacteria bacterium]